MEVTTKQTTKYKMAAMDGNQFGFNLARSTVLIITARLDRPFRAFQPRHLALAKLDHGR